MLSGPEGLLYDELLYDAPKRLVSVREMNEGVERFENKRDIQHQR